MVQIFSVSGPDFVLRSRKSGPENAAHGSNVKNLEQRTYPESGIQTGLHVWFGPGNHGQLDCAAFTGEQCRHLVSHIYYVNVLAYF